MNNLTEENGRPQDTPGDQGWKEAQRQDSLQLQACATDGSSERKARDYIVHIENASDFKAAFIIRQVKTVPQLVQGICDWHPQLCHESILMRVSDSRTGSMHRVFYEKELPSHTDTVYVYLSLRKHTIMGGKIEHNYAS
jgi:hypothetical protein